MGGKGLNDLDYIITDMPGWQSAEESTRKRIVATAATYLANAESQPDSWLGRQPLPLNRIDLAALRGLLLLHEQDPAAYAALPALIWQKWAPTIVGLPRHGVVDKSSDVLAVTRDALAKAPAEFIGTVVALICGEKALERSPDGHPSSGLRFHILCDLEGCWDDKGLKGALYAEMVAPDTMPAEYAVLLGALLRVGFQPAIDHAAAALSAGGSDALPIAQVLLERMSPGVWPAMWAKLSADDDLARAVLLYAAGQFSLATPFYAGLSEDAIADLYLLMSESSRQRPMGRGRRASSTRSRACPICGTARPVCWCPWAPKRPCGRCAVWWPRTPTCSSSRSSSAAPKPRCGSKRGRR